MNEVHIKVEISGIDKAMEKAQALFDKIEKAKTAATELALIIKELSVEIDGSSKAKRRTIQRDDSNGYGTISCHALRADQIKAE